MSRAACLLAACALVAIGCAAQRSGHESRVDGHDSRLLAGGDATDDDGEVEIPLDQVPEVVLNAAKEAVPGIELSGAAREVEDGETIYELQGTAGGTSYEIEVNAAGKVVEVENGEDDDDD